MTSRAFHLAQINIGRLNAPVDDPSLVAFMAALDPVNTLAEQSPGFVWRLKDESGHATYIRAYDDPQMIVNVTVWESLEALRDFTYLGVHKGVLGRRNEWFEKLDGPYMALWWIDAGAVPTTGEGVARIDHLARHGPGEHAFTFAQPFPRPA
ncbi:MAG: DUF3291 domain-containing protein [Rhodospirillaceae bacterium]|nr:DUF3291 domain-containing protein [Rhodospirillaceae bacterium]